MKLRPIKRASVFLNFFLSFLSIKGLSLVPPVRERPSFLRTNPQSALWFFLFLILWIGPAYLSSAASARQKRTALGISFFYWICSFLGYFFKTWGTVTFSGWEGISNTINFICYEIGLFCLFYAFVLLMIVLLDKYRAASVPGGMTASSKKLFILSVCFLLICWAPWFLQGAPLTATGDSNNHISQAAGTIPLMENHPILYTLYIRLLFTIGGSTQAGAFLYSILQLVISAAVFSASVCFADRIFQRRTVTLGMIFWFALYPFFPLYGITMWKDIFFGVLISLIVLNICMLRIADGSQQKKLLIHNVFLSLLLCFIRHNGILIYIPTAIVLTLVCKRFRKFYASLCLGTIAFYLLVQFVVIPLSGVLTWRNSEGFSIPLQQIARAVFYDPDSLTDEQKQVISDHFYGKKLEDLYNPVLSNNVKYALNEQAFEQDPQPMIRLWLELGKTHPKAFIEAPLINSYGYWYPEAVKLNNVAFGMNYDNFCGIHPQPLVRLAVLEKIIDFMYNDRYYTVPVLSWMFTPGLYAWILFFLWKYSRYSKNRFLPAFVPLLSLWIQMLGCPAFCELRYVYGLVTALPVLMCCALIPLPDDGKPLSL